MKMFRSLLLALMGVVALSCALATAEAQHVARRDTQHGLCCGQSAAGDSKEHVTLVAGIARKPKPTKRGSLRLDDTAFQGAEKRDATEELTTMKIKKGRNLVDRSPSGLQLLVEIQKGRKPRYAIVDEHGRRVRSTIYRVVHKETKETTCWACGVDEEGNIHAWEVLCPEIMAPWDGKAERGRKLPPPPPDNDRNKTI